MNEAIQIAQQKANKSAEQNRNQYNEKVHGNYIVNGDRVLSQNSSETGDTGKLQAHWENTIYLVVGKEGNLTVRNIKRESSEGTSTKRSIATSLYLAIFCHPRLKLTETKIITKFHKIKAHSQIQQ